MHTPEQHHNDIMDQFTRQAVPFAERHRGDHELLSLLTEASGVSPQDRVLDIACGPGIVTCAFAAVAREVTGIDFVPAMLDRARALQQEKGLLNISWKQGEATALPFPDASFDGVITRFSFHHYLDPVAAFGEMRRVCKPGGIIMVADVAPAVPARDAYDAMEKLRDPSHTRALTEPEFIALGETAGVKLSRTVRYELESDLEGLLASSFPPAGNAGQIRDLLERDVSAGTDTLGIRAHRRSGGLYFFFPVLILVWKNMSSPGPGL